MWVMGEWAVGQWIVGVTSFRKMYGYMGLRSIGSDQLDRFRTQRYNQEKKKEKKDFASSRSVPFGSDKNWAIPPRIPLGSMLKFFSSVEQD